MGINGYIRIVRDEYDRDSLGVELLKHLQDFDAGVRIEVARGLVGQHQGRLVDQRPGNGHALLLSAGHLRGFVVAAIGQPETIQKYPAQPAGFGGDGPIEDYSPGA